MSCAYTPQHACPLLAAAANRSPCQNLIAFPTENLACPHALYFRMALAPWAHVCLR